MSDDLKIRGPADAKRVNVNEPWEVEYWTKKWNVTPDQLKNAVRRVGVMADRVARELGNK